MALDPILVVCGDGDLVKDRAKQYAERLKNWGKDVKYEEFEGIDEKLAWLISYSMFLRCNVCLCLFERRMKLNTFEKTL
ncbi:hypothetical protein R6Q57_002918 [Mikania cordata]